MTDLVEFIEARLSTDEAHAKKDLHMLDRASNGGAWEYGVGYNLPYSELGEGGSIGRLTATYGRALADGEPDQHNADVMLVARMVRSARRRAERVLREVEAKRRILARHQPVEVWAGHDHIPPGQLGARMMIFVNCSSCIVNHDPEGKDYDCRHGEVEWPCPEVCDLAAAYADHPDYLTEWSPENVVPPE